MASVYLLVVAAVACSKPAPPSKVEGAPTHAPDESYETDDKMRVFVWKCDARNERVTMSQQCMVECGPWDVDRTLCPLDQAGRDATRTASERSLETRPRHPMPENGRWR